MRVWPVVGGCTLLALGLLSWFGSTLTGSAGFGGPSQESLMDSLLGLPGILLGGGVALLLWGFTDDPKKR
jgi:hypothetical protein